jgi:hypothetical protein
MNCYYCKCELDADEAEDSDVCDYCLNNIDEWFELDEDAVIVSRDEMKCGKCERIPEMCECIWICNLCNEETCNCELPF